MGSDLSCSQEAVLEYERKDSDMSVRTSSRRSLASGQAGVIAALLVVGVLVVTGFQTRDRSDVSSSRGAILRPGVVLPGGRIATLSEATAQFSTPIYRPATGSASDVTLDELWIRTAREPEVYMIYRSGVVVIVRPETTGQDTATYADAQIGDGIPGRIINLGPHEAFLVPEVEGPSTGSVRFLMGGAIITVIGNGSLSAEELIEIAQSIVNRSAEVAAEHA